MTYWLRYSRRLAIAPWLAAALGLCLGASAAEPERIDSPHLPNAYRLVEKVISGGEPADEAAFRALQKLGIRTVISVDGARPQVELAKKYGLRYVHLPHGYDGVSDQRGQELAKAVRDLPGPIYIHCHHGRHRSPAASAVACVSAGLIPPEQALSVLRAAGTSPHYRGLYESAEGARRIDDRALDGLKVEFVATAKIPPLADAMVEIEHAHDHLTQLAENGWQRLAGKPDLDPPHEALLLREHYRELLRTDDVQRQPAEFRRIMQSAEEQSASLERQLRDWIAAGRVGDAPEAIGRALVATSQSCVDCHRQFRDVPLSEKGALSEKGR